MMVSLSEEDETVMLFSSLLSSDLANNTISDQRQHERSTDIGELKVVKRERRRKYCRRSREGEQARKRRLSDEQVRLLEMRFEEEKKLESGRKLHLASESGLDPKQVSVWFQNRRARLKTKQLEDEYSKLKSEHQTTILQKCHLEAEVLELKQKLEEAEKKALRLSGGNNPDDVASAGDMISSTNTSTTSFSVDTTHYCPPFIIGEEHNHVNFLDWANFYGM